MKTSYKSRAWWIALALSYAMGISFTDDGFVASQQDSIWATECAKAMAAALAPEGDPRLVIQYPESYASMAGDFAPAFS